MRDKMRNVYRILVRKHKRKMTTWGFQGLLDDNNKMDVTETGYELPDCSSTSEYRRAVGPHEHHIEASESEVVGFFNLLNPPSSTVALGSTQPLKEMSTRNLLRDKGQLALRTETSPMSVGQLLRKCGSLEISQCYRPRRPVTGIALLVFSFANCLASEKPRLVSKVSLNIVHLHPVAHRYFTFTFNCFRLCAASMF
jgi:hypothetical protein